MDGPSAPSPRADEQWPTHRPRFPRIRPIGVQHRGDLLDGIVSARGAIPVGGRPGAQISFKALSSESLLEGKRRDGNLVERERNSLIVRVDHLPLRRPVRAYDVAAESPQLP